MEEKINKLIKSKQEAAAVNTVAASFMKDVTRKLLILDFKQNLLQIVL